MKHVVLIDLDVLLDTRVATLLKINEPEAIKMLENGFCARSTDDISDMTNVISNDEYKKEYATRNIDTLKKSRLTNYIFELAGVISDLAKSLVAEDTRIKEPCIVINYYPYQNLDEDTLSDIIYAIQCYTTDVIDIKATYYEPRRLDLAFLKENSILTYITYDFVKWFESVFNVAKGKKGIISYPKLTIIAPMITPRADSFDNFDAESLKILQNKTPFEFMQLYWAPMFGLEFCPIELMSLVDTSIID